MWKEFIKLEILIPILYENFASNLLVPNSSCFPLCFYVPSYLVILKSNLAILLRSLLIHCKCVQSRIISEGPFFHQQASKSQPNDLPHGSDYKCRQIILHAEFFFTLVLNYRYSIVWSARAIWSVP